MAANSSTALRAVFLDQFVKTFKNGCIEIYSGSQPDSADAAVAGTLLARITKNGGSWTEGAAANGLQFQRDGIYAGKPTADSWKLTGIAAGTAGWFRIRANGADPGGSTLSLCRVDGAIGVEGDTGDYQLYLPDSLAITASSSINVTAFRYALPPLT